MSRIDVYNKGHSPQAIAPLDVAGLGRFVQKALYLGVGLASYASEKASEQLANLPAKVQQMADDMVARGEMSAEEAKRWIDETIARAQANTPTTEPARVTQERPADPASSTATGPREIPIDDDDEPGSPANGPQPTNSDPTAEDSDPHLAAMRRQVADLEAELRRLSQPE